MNKKLQKYNIEPFDIDKNILTKSYMLKIEEWYGRFGNNLFQLSNAIYISEKSQGGVTFPTHPLIANEIFDFGGNLENKILSSVFFSQGLESLDWEELFNQRSRILNKYVLPLIKPYKKTPLKYDLIVHIRGDDIFKEEDESCDVHHFYVQSPLSYFIKIFEIEQAKNILLISQDKKNPVVNSLLRLKQYCIAYQSASIETDLNILLNAKNL